MTGASTRCTISMARPMPPVSPCAPWLCSGTSTPTGLARAAPPRLVARRSTTSMASSITPTGSITCSSPPPWEGENYEPRNPMESAKNKAKRSTIINAYVLLKADRSCGWTNADIASAYEVSTKKVEQLKKRFVEAGFDAALSRKPVTNVHCRKITGEEEAHLIALCCSQAPEGYARWTLRMLADKMVE